MRWGVVGVVLCSPPPGRASRLERGVSAGIPGFEGRPAGAWAAADWTVAPAVGPEKSHRMFGAGRRRTRLAIARCQLADFRPASRQARVARAARSSLSSRERIIVGTLFEARGSSGRAYPTPLSSTSVWTAMFTNTRSRGRPTPCPSLPVPGRSSGPSALGAAVQR